MAGQPRLDAPDRSSTSFKLPFLHEHAIDVLRVGAGLVWLVNLVFIVDPSNRYWSTFSATALSFAPTTIGGPGFAQFVAQHPLFFAWTIAVLTAYLAAALLLGLTTRIACFIGASFSAVLIATQFGSTFLFPGGTDVGAHPLYILIYAVLVLGGAGKTFSLDAWIRTALHRWRVSQPVTGRPRPLGRPNVSPLTPGGLLAYFAAATLISFGVGFGLVVAIPTEPSGAGGSAPSGPATFVNLTISVDPTSGWPEYAPANFSVPRGLVVVTIIDNDSPMNWTGCPCPVKGTLGGTELVNGTSAGVVPGQNIAHSFTIPAVGLQVFSPGLSVVQFDLELDRTGQYLWYCIVPCGTGADPYNTAPMGVPGFMQGTLTVR
ncbi:MAG TPA: hypothetical protein VGX00_00590 [Thermoplasmata archaeon]|nr:hypothetical protein [Thermoplasmata archaeon]